MTPAQADRCLPSRALSKSQMVVSAPQQHDGRVHVAFIALITSGPVLAFQGRENSRARGLDQCKRAVDKSGTTAVDRSDNWPILGWLGR